MSPLKPSSATKLSHEDLVAIARATAKLAGGGNPSLQPGTVVGYDNTRGDTQIHLDGDEAGSVMIASNLTSSFLFGGQRVMIAFYPPRGTFVIGMIPPVAGAGTWTNSQSIPINAYTSISWLTELQDSSGYINTVTAPTLITIPQGMAGTYAVTFTVFYSVWVSATVSGCALAAMVNGASIATTPYRTSTGGTGQAVLTFLRQFASGDEILFQARQDSSNPTTGDFRLELIRLVPSLFLE
jgi:hypothetical protein